MAGQQKPTITVTAYATVTTDITSDVMFPLEAEMGLAGNRYGDRHAVTGTMYFDLDNFTTVGRYYPGHSNCLAGWKKSTPIEISFTYDGKTVTERWYVDNCETAGVYEERVRVSLVDWMVFPGRHPIQNPDYLPYATADTGIAEVTSALAIQPQNTDLDAGTNIFPALLDTVSRNQKALREYSKLVSTEPFSYLYLKRSEILRFENMMSRNGTRSLSKVPVHSDDLGFLLDESSNTITDHNDNQILYSSSAQVSVSTGTAGQIRQYDDDNGKGVLNRYVSQYHPRRTDETPIILYEPERPIPIASGQRLQFSAFYIDPTTKQTINAVPPEQDIYTKSLLDFEVDSIGIQLAFPDSVGRSWISYDVSAESNIFGTSPPFGDRAGYFDGTSAWLEAPDSDDWDFGSGDFCIDYWEYRFNTSSGKSTMSRDAGASFPAFQIGRSNGTNLLVDMSSAGASNDIANGKSMGSITTGQFVHYEVSRTGNNFFTFKDGVLQDTWTSSSALNASTANLFVGKHSTNYNSASIDELRIRKGIGGHTANFAPPTEKYQQVGTFLFGWTNEDGTGTELTPDLTISVDYGTEGMSFDITNNSTSSGFLFPKTYGYGVHLDSAPEYSVENSVSIAEFGTIEGRSDLSYAQDIYLPILEAERIVEEEREERNVLNRIEMNANSSTANMMRFMHCDIGSLVAVEIEKTEKDAWHWIQRRGYRINPNNLIDYWWELREHYSLQKGLDDLAVEFAGGAATDCVTFPYMPYMDGIVEFSISAWIYMDTDPVSNDYFIAGPCGELAGSYLYMAAGVGKLAFKTYRMDGNAGIWITPANTIATSTWKHVVVTIKLENLTVPIFYVDGSVVSNIELSSNALGAPIDAEGVNFFVGNLKTPTINYARCFDGKIKDVRFYPFILGQAQVAEIYNSGTQSPTVGNDGQVFQAFAVKSSRYASYQDLTLDSTTKLIDAHLGIVGTVNGSPVSRVP